MPPKAAATGKQYDEVTVLGLLMTIKTLGGTYNKTLADMAALDGKRSTSSFEHSSRAANKLAGELLEKQKAGHTLKPIDIGRVVEGGPAEPSTSAKAANKRKGNNGEGAGSAKKTRTSKAAKQVDSAAADGDLSPLP